MYKYSNEQFPFDVYSSGMHYIKESFIVIDVPFLLLAVFYECYVAGIHSTIPYEVIQKAMKTPDKSFNMNNDYEHHLHTHIIQFTYINLFNTLTHTYRPTQTHMTFDLHCK